MKIVHIASFAGNMGCIINHKGFYDSIIQKLGIEFVKNERIEMREFYFSAKNQRFFDEEFADYINSYDLCIFGGGSFFDLQWENSKTGVTLDMSENFIEGIKIPVLINGIGYHEYPGVTNKNICEKFKSFLENISNRPNWLVTVRNDGSYERMIARYGEKFVERVNKVPDSAFFYIDQEKWKKTDRAQKVLGLCITNDLFCEAYNKGITAEEYNQKVAGFIESRVDMGNQVILFPHVPGDLEIICNILKNVSNDAKRKSVIVAPYNSTGESAIDELMKYYLKCDCIVGMRFHSLVSGIRLGIPTIAIAGHEQIEHLFRDLQLEDYCLKADGEFSETELSRIVDLCLAQPDVLLQLYAERYQYLDKMEEKYRNLVHDFLKNDKDRRG